MHGITMRFSKLYDFFARDIWAASVEEANSLKGFWLRHLKIVVLAVRDFKRDRCSLRASALTYYTLLSIVPLLALVFGIAKGFGFKDFIERKVYELLIGHDEVAERVIEFANTSLEQVRGGVIAGVGIAILFLTVVKVLSYIESSFNDIWGIEKPRSLGRRFSDYLSLAIIFPVFFLLSSSITVLISTRLESLTDAQLFFGAFGPIAALLLRVVSLAAFWLLFSAMYIYIPNTKVQFHSGILGGIVAGTLLQLLQDLYIKFQVGAAQAGAVYGSFAALPLFIVWLQLSWMIVLFGAELTFAAQHLKKYDHIPVTEKLNAVSQRLLGLLVAAQCVERFRHGEGPWSAREMSAYFGVPIAVVTTVLRDLAAGKIVLEARGDDGDEVYYNLAQDPSGITVGEVCLLLDYAGSKLISLTGSPLYSRVCNALTALECSLSRNPMNISLADLAADTATSGDSSATVL